MLDIRNSNIWRKKKLNDAKLLAIFDIFKINIKEIKNVNTISITVFTNSKTILTKIHEKSVKVLLKTYYIKKQ